MTMARRSPPGMDAPGRVVPTSPLGQAEAPLASSAHSHGLFHLEFSADSLLGRSLPRHALRGVERALGLSRLNGVYDRAAAFASDCRGFLSHVLRDLACELRVTDADLARIPRTGPAVVVANHPFGAIEGVLLAWMLSAIRPDFRIMANYLLGRIPELRDCFILVDPFGGIGSAAGNVRPLRQAVRHVESGGLLVVFPAGEVSHLDLRRRCVTDPSWSRTVARIVRKTEAPVVPIYFDGRNSGAFQLLGLVHPRLRTAMLAVELFKRCGAPVDMRVGSPVPFRRLEAMDDASMTRYLRHRTYLLRHRPRAATAASGAVARQATQSSANVSSAAAARPLSAPTATRLEAVIPPVDPALMRREVEALSPAEHVLASNEQLSVYHASAGRIPAVLREIGRLRELTFRATGEGTGRDIDLDSFDYDYLHLFVWNHERGEVVGAYRLGQTDRILPHKGRSGLYTSTLFDYGRPLLDRINPALEMGRSFVREEYQRAYAPLLLLWKGIGRFCVAQPRYRYLFGAVSISNNYQTASKQLMVRFLSDHHCPADLAAMVRARTPFPLARGRRRADDGADAFAYLKDADELSERVADLEPDHKGLPVLLRQYLKLGAKYVSFNVDRQFSDVVDGLIVVDLAKTEPRVLERYMGKDGYRSFMAAQSEAPASGLSPPPHAEPALQTVGCDSAR